MLLFSTTLSIKKEMTPDKFIELVLEWNINSPHEDNRIGGIEWNGQRNVRYGDSNLWLDIEEYRNGNIIAVRYEKKEENGVVWDTDYVMNFNDMKMSIILERSYYNEEFTTTGESFSTPYFITLLIKYNYIEDDDNLRISKKPLYIGEENAEILSNLIEKKVKYRLPSVYVSKTKMNEDPVDVSMLASRLKGVAHVLVQDDIKNQKLINEVCQKKNTYNGAICVYYPNSAEKHRVYLYRRTAGKDRKVMERIVQDVIQYASVQYMDTLYTWDGVGNAILTDRFKSQRDEKSEIQSRMDAMREENSEFMELYDDEIKRLQDEKKSLVERNDELVARNQALSGEVYGLRSKLNKNGNHPVLYSGDEYEFYDGEIREIILSCLEEVLKSVKDGSRRQHVIEDIIGNNRYEMVQNARKNKIKKLFRGYRIMSPNMKNDLRDFGFEIKEDGKHIKLTYFGDNRYMTSVAKTPSDNCTGDNVAGTICREML